MKKCLNLKNFEFFTINFYGVSCTIIKKNKEVTEAAEAGVVTEDTAAVAEVAVEAAEVEAAVAVAVPNSSLTELLSLFTQLWVTC